MSSYRNFGGPKIIVNEIDLTGGVTGASLTVGGMVGNFRWGPVEKIEYIGDEKSLVKTFGSPNKKNNVDFLSFAYFLKRSTNLIGVRTITSDAKNAYSTPDENAVVDIVIKNDEHWKNVKQSVITQNPGLFVAKYPGEIGNSIGISVCLANDIDTENSFDVWEFSGIFPDKPETSEYAAAAGASNDEIHVVVYDKDGKISGTKGTILEKYEFVSLAEGAKLDDGSSNNFEEVINKKSSYVFVADFSTKIPKANKEAFEGVSYTTDDESFELTFTFVNEEMTGGVDSGPLGLSEYMKGYDLFKDKWLDVDLVISPSMPSSTDHITMVNNLSSIAKDKTDCIVVSSPSREAVIGANEDDIVDNIITEAKLYANSSFLFTDDMFFTVYDKYNDLYIDIPAASSTAGLFAFTDENYAPWYSPAGPKRGVYDSSITSMVWKSTDNDRDRLYNAGVNSIINTPNGSIQLNGDKTKLVRNSAFSRINVRRLFIEIKKISKSAASNVMFEFNDEFTRSQFVNEVEPQLRSIKGDRGIYDFKIVCDETNNTPDVIDDNMFVASIFIKPARSINWVEINMVAVRTGVEFSEVVGNV